MKKVTKLLSVFVLAGAIGASAGALAGCTHKHTYGDWQKSPTEHWKEANCGHDVETGRGAHQDKNNDGKCDTCQYEMGATVKMPATANNVVAELTTSTFNLNTTDVKASIAASDIKVYFAVGNNKLDGADAEVPTENWEAKITDTAGAEITDWTNIRKDGEYTVTATLVNVVDNDGDPVDLAAIAKFKVNNAIASIAFKSGTQEQPAGSKDTMTSDWVFEATLANGDTQPLTAAEIQIGEITPLVVGVHEVTVSLKANPSVSTKVTYEIKANENMKTQSYMIAPNMYKDKTVTSGTNLVLDETHKVTWVNPKGLTLNSSGRAFGDKYFPSRFNTNGAYTSEKADGFKFEDLNKIDGLAQGATVKTKITVYAMTSGNESQPRILSIAKVGEDGTVTPDATQAQLVGKSDTNCFKVEFEVNEEGTYFIAGFNKNQFGEAGEEGGALATGTTGGYYVYYIQVDVMITGDSTQQDIPLGEGTDEITAISASYTGTGTHTVELGTEFDDAIANYTFKATKINDVTYVKKEEAITIADGITFSGNENFKTNPGKYDIVASYEGVETHIEIVVASAVEGVYGATVKVDPEFNTELADNSAKATLKLEDLIAGKLGENSAATAEVVSATITGGTLTDEAITTAGVELGAGEYTITASIKVSEGEKNVTFNGVTCKLTITVHADGVTVLADSYAEESTALKDAGIDNAYFSISTDKNLNLTAYGKNGGTASYNGKDFHNAWLPSGNVSGTDDRGFTITAKKDIVISIYFTVSDGSFGNREGALVWTITRSGSALPQEEGDTVTSAAGSAFKQDIKLKTGDTCRVSAVKKGSSSDLRPAIFGFFATEDTTAAASSASLSAPVAVLPSKKEN